MRATVLVLLGLVAFTMANHATIKKVHPFNMNVAEIENEKAPEHKASFGDLITMLQSSTFLQNKAISDFLEKKRQGIHADHDAHLALYTEQKSACTEEVEFRNGEIKAATDSEAAAVSHRDLCAEEKTKAESLRDLAEAALVVYNADLVTLRNNRQDQIATYNIRKAKLSAAEAAIQKTLDYIDELELAASTSVAQNSVLIQHVNALLAVSVAIGSSHKVLPIYSQLLQAHSKGSFDINDLENVKQLIGGLLNNVHESQNQLEAQEASDKAAFEEAETNLLALIAKLENQVTEAKAYIEKMDQCWTQENDIAGMAAGKKQRNQLLLEQASKICEDNENEWNTAESARKHQVELLNQLEFAIEALEHEYGDSLLPNIETVIHVEEAAPAI